MQRLPSFRLAALSATSLLAGVGAADDYRHILLTGYWPPTNEMVRHFSTNPERNPDGWEGANWEGSGYHVFSYFPEFPNGVGQGVGDLEVDYQDTSADFWPIAEAVEPVALITFSRGSFGRDWEVEFAQRNLIAWIDDYTPPFQPTPAPPDGTVPSGTERYSTLPMTAIRDAVNESPLGLRAMIDWSGYGGAFLSEFIAYHGTWYTDTHIAIGDPARCVSGGHIHVSPTVTVEEGVEATHLTLRVLIEYLDEVLGPVCLADVDENDVLDIFDVLAFLERFEASDPRADVNLDGTLDVFDALEFLSLFSAGCP